MITILENYSLRSRNTMRIDAKCSMWVDFTSESDLEKIAELIEGKPYIILGGGSNVLFTTDFNGIIIHSSILDFDISFQGETIIVKAGSGVCMDELIDKCCQSGFWGVENLSGIPGDVGASAVQNIGAYGVESKDTIKEVRCYDLRKRKFVTFTNAECEFGYRWSMFKRNDVRYRYIITSVMYELSQTPQPKLEYSNLNEQIDKSVLTPLTVRDVVIKMRNNKLPAVDAVGSAGSFFKNPVVERSVYEHVCGIATSLFGDDVTVPYYKVNESFVKIPAAWLIEKVGLKGYELGNAAIWHNQPLVLVNLTGKASANELLELESIVINKVYETFGIKLEAEVDHV